MSAQYRTNSAQIAAQALEIADLKAGVGQILALLQAQVPAPAPVLVPIVTPKAVAPVTSAPTITVEQYRAACAAHDYPVMRAYVAQHCETAEPAKARKALKVAKAATAEARGLEATLEALHTEGLALQAVETAKAEPKAKPAFLTRTPEEKAKAKAHNAAMAAHIREMGLRPTGAVWAAVKAGERNRATLTALEAAETGTTVTSPAKAVKAPRKARKSDATTVTVIGVDPQVAALEAVGLTPAQIVAALAAI